MNDSSSVPGSAPDRAPDSAAEPAHPRILDFAVIGVQKGATSWLYYCLDAHPALSLPRSKREVEFLGGSDFEARGVEGFRARWDARDGLVGDVSVDYLHDPRAPRALAEFAPSARLITTVRDPIERAASAWAWKIRKKELEARPLDTYLREALDYGLEPPPSHDVLTRGLYDLQLGRFGPEHPILLLGFGEIASDPEGALARIWDFLGVAPHTAPPSSRRPKANAYSDRLVRLEGSLPDWRVVRRALAGVNRAVLALRGQRPPPRPSAATQARLREFFAADAEALLARAEGRAELQREIRSWGLLDG